MHEEARRQQHRYSVYSSTNKHDRKSNNQQKAVGFANLTNIVKLFKIDVPCPQIKILRLPLCHGLYKNERCHINTSKSASKCLRQ